jgi:hypothetical protein
MSPDQIKTCIEKHYGGLIHCCRIVGGWSFYYGTPLHGYESNRLMRVKRLRFLSPTSMKLAATSRNFQLAEFAFLGEETDLIHLMGKEIAIYLADRRKRPYNHEFQSVFLPSR